MTALKYFFIFLAIFILVSCSQPQADSSIPSEAATPTNTSTATPVPTSTPTATSVPTNTPTPRPVGKINTDNSPLRTGPGSEYDIIDRTRRGDELEILAQDKTGKWVWAVLAGNDRRLGWLAAGLVDFISLADVPVQTQVSPTPTRKPTSTPTPSPDAIVNVDMGNLRAGPGTNYDIVGQVKEGTKIEILGKNNAGDWVNVRLKLGAQSGQKTGWLSITLLDLNIPLSQVSLADIPPTPTPSIPTATPTPKVCPAVPALVQIRNYLGVALTIQFSGPDQFTLIIPAGDNRNICVPPGDYATTSSASGYYTDYDTETFTTGACACWDFYDGLITPLCNCPDFASSYFRP